MESDRIDKLLEAYFKGATTLEEESTLFEYFNNQKVADHLLQYKPIFVGISAARKEHTKRDFQWGDKKTVGKISPWWLTVAAMLVLAIGIGGFFLSNRNSHSQEEKEALIAFENSKKAMFLLSENLNKGAKQISLVNQFDLAKDKFWKEPVGNN